MGTYNLPPVGNTPMAKCDFYDLPVYIKFESYNPFGSMKDRAASNIIRRAFELGLINNESTIIESSSGNFGIALAAVCRKYGLHFICVIDTNTNKTCEKMLSVYGAEIIKIEVPDIHGGYLVNRLIKVKEILTKRDNIYWINQYENLLNAESYHSLADEILSKLHCPDYIFIPVSSGGTITGVSYRIKEVSPQTKVIAVDSEGSVIFGGSARKRYLPGVGSSIVPAILINSKIDDVVMIEESDMIRQCRCFFDSTGLMIGGSSGACLCAINKYNKRRIFQQNSKIVTIFADRGERYIDTIFNDNWCRNNNLI